MINKISAITLTPIFTSVAQTKGFTHDFTSDPKVQQNHLIDQQNRGKKSDQRTPLLPYDGKGYMIYESGIYELWNEFGRTKLSMLARSNEVKVTAEKDTEDVADALATEIDKQIPNLQVNVRIV